MNYIGMSNDVLCYVVWIMAWVEYVCDVFMWCCGVVWCSVVECGGKGMVWYGVVSKGVIVRRYTYSVV
jgi:hypothetical protein